MLPILGTVLYLLCAAAIAAGGAAWLWLWSRSRRGGTARPAELSPVDAASLGLLAAAAAGALAAALGLGRDVSWSLLFFSAFIAALALRCVMFLVQARGAKPPAWSFLVPAAALGAVLALAG